MLTPDKIIEIFIKKDDFYKEFEMEITKYRLEAGNTKLRNRKTLLPTHKVITIRSPFTLVISPISSTFIFVIPVPIINMISLA